MRLTIVSPNRDAYSETFIRAQIERLGGDLLILNDGFLPRRHADGRWLLSPSMLGRVSRRVNMRLTGRTPDQLLEARIAALLRAHRTEAVLAHYGPTGMAMLGACRAARVPLVVHFHGIDAFHSRLLKDHGNYERLHQEAAAIVVVSREMESQLLALGAPREKVHYNCYGVDVDGFRPGDPAAASPLFIAVGRFVDKKAPLLTLSAFNRALGTNPAIRLQMIGDGPLLDACRRTVATWGIGHAVEFAGVLDHATIARRMREARAFVQHSVVPESQDHEGTPLSVLEAMASALPVIATRHGGIPDVVEHNVQGLLGLERDVEVMAGHMLELAGDPQRAAAMGAKGRARVMERFTIAQSIAGLQAIIRGAIAQ